MSRSDGKWRPSMCTVPTCKPVNCGDFGNINNAHVFQTNGDGMLNDLGSVVTITCKGSVVTITCKAGYMIQGSNSVTCNADGRWGVKPDCVKSSCDVHPATKTKCVEKSDFSVDGSMLTLLCKETSASLSVTKVGMGTAICIDNQWDELNMGCFCDCKVKTRFMKIPNYTELYRITTPNTDLNMQNNLFFNLYINQICEDYFIMLFVAHNCVILYLTLPNYTYCILYISILLNYSS